MTVQALLAELKQSMERRDRHRINRIAADLLRRSDALGSNWRSLAEVLLHNGEVSLASEAIGRFVKDRGGEPDARFVQAALLARAGRLERAKAILDQLPQTVPDGLSNAFTRGNVELNMGDVDAARSELLRAVELNPASGQSWYALAMTGRLGGSTEISQRIIDARPMLDSAHKLELASYLFARGKIFDELGDATAAFDSWNEAASLVDAERSYNAAADQASARAATQGYERGRISAISQTVTVPTSNAIFVTGLARSGTTLVEQILTSHSSVAGGTELGKFALVVRTIRGTDYESLMGHLTRGGLVDGLASDYLHLLAERLGSGRVVDKTTDASRYLGVAASILPEAKFIWMRRNPLDIALSCFTTHFHQGHAWSYDLVALAQHMVLERELLIRWSEVLGERLFVLDYELLVTDPDELIGRLLDYCGLTHEAAAFSPHQNRRQVATASVSQVRQPISADAVGRSERYRKHLEPFIKSYEQGSGEKL